MSRIPKNLDVVAGNGTGASFKCKRFTNQTVVLSPGKTGETPNCVLQLQVSNNDGAKFVNYGNPVSDGSDTPIAIDQEAWTDLQVITSGYQTGTPTASWCGDEMY